MARTQRDTTTQAPAVANEPHNNIDAAECNHVVHSLVFLKYISVAVKSDIGKKSVDHFICPAISPFLV
ncbi:hypothetical protein [Variovorax sp. LjRoot178]|uniref:hypothetical protein n=1 Tax=Variovorax sp. LjRoot178 TaxID=3342277 RepID=UPI003ECC62CC